MVKDNERGLGLGDVDMDKQPRDRFSGFKERARPLATGAIKEAGRFGDWLGRTITPAGRWAERVGRMSRGEILSKIKSFFASRRREQPVPEANVPPKKRGVGKEIAKDLFFIAQGLPFIAPIVLSVRMVNMGVRGVLGVKETGNQRTSREKYVQKMGGKTGLERVKVDLADTGEYYGGMFRALIGKAKETFETVGLAYKGEYAKEAWVATGLGIVVVAVGEILAKKAVQKGLPSSLGGRARVLWTQRLLPLVISRAALELYKFKRGEKFQTEEFQQLTETIMQVTASLVTIRMVADVVGSLHHSHPPAEKPVATPEHTPETTHTPVAHHTPEATPTHTTMLHPTDTPEPIIAPTHTPESTVAPTHTLEPPTVMQNVDFNGDGVADAQIVDVNHDGIADRAIAHNGQVFQVRDLDGDGRVDLVSTGQVVPSHASPEYAGQGLWLKVGVINDGKPALTLEDGTIFGRDMNGNGVLDIGDLMKSPDGIGYERVTADNITSLHDGRLINVGHGVLSTPGIDSPVAERFDFDNNVVAQDWDGDGKFEVQKLGDKWYFDVDGDNKIDIGKDAEVTKMDINGRPVEARTPDGQIHQIKDGKLVEEISPEKLTEKEQVTLSNGKQLVLGEKGGVVGLIQQKIYEEHQGEPDWSADRIASVAYQEYLSQVAPNLSDDIPLAGGSPVVYPGESLDKVLSRILKNE